MYGMASFGTNFCYEGSQNSSYQYQKDRFYTKRRAHMIKFSIILKYELKFARGSHSALKNIFLAFPEILRFFLISMSKN